MAKEKTPAKQHQQPGIEAKMSPAPEYIKPDYKAAGKLTGKVELITGADSGIGRAVSIHFAKGGADIAIVYPDEDVDAQATKELVEEGRTCLLLKGDVKKAKFCQDAVAKGQKRFGQLNILVNNAGMQFPQKDVKAITEEQQETTFRTNIFAYFYFAEVAVNAVAPGPV